MLHLDAEQRRRVAASPSVVRADAAGNCTATAVDLTAASSYMIVQNDFTATGGDGYPNFGSRMVTQEILEEITADYVTANSPLNPGRQGRSERSDQLLRHQWRRRCRTARR